MDLRERGRRGFIEIGECESLMVRWRWWWCAAENGGGGDLEAINFSLLGEELYPGINPRHFNRCNTITRMVASSNHQRVSFSLQNTFKYLICLRYYIPRNFN